MSTTDIILTAAGTIICILLGVLAVFAQGFMAEFKEQGKRIDGIEKFLGEHKIYMKLTMDKQVELEGRYQEVLKYRGEFMRDYGPALETIRRKPSR